MPEGNQHLADNDGKGNLYQLDFPDNFFDAVFAHNVLEHLNDPNSALQEIRRVLKPGGFIGVRDVDWGGNLLAPDDKFLHQYLAIYEAYWIGGGGSPNLGRHLRGLLTAAGFSDVEASASFEVYSDPEGRRFVSQIAVGRLSEPDYVASVLGSGLATQEQLSAISSAWSAWPESPGAFLALAHGEAVAKKG